MTNYEALRPNGDSTVEAIDLGESKVMGRILVYDTRDGKVDLKSRQKRNLPMGTVFDLKVKSEAMMSLRVTAQTEVRYVGEDTKSIDRKWTFAAKIDYLSQPVPAGAEKLGPGLWQVTCVTVAIHGGDSYMSFSPISQGDGQESQL